MDPHGHPQPRGLHRSVLPDRDAHGVELQDGRRAEVGLRRVQEPPRASGRAVPLRRVQDRRPGGARSPGAQGPPRARRHERGSGGKVRGLRREGEEGADGDEGGETSTSEGGDTPKIEENSEAKE